MGLVPDEGVKAFPFESTTVIWNRTDDPVKGRKHLKDGLNVTEFVVKLTLVLLGMLRAPEMGVDPAAVTSAILTVIVLSKPKLAAALLLLTVMVTSPGVMV